nr:transmembrane protein 45B-like [Rhipicephalus microplus]
MVGFRDVAQLHPQQAEQTTLRMPLLVPGAVPLTEVQHRRHLEDRHLFLRHRQRGSRYNGTRWHRRRGSHPAQSMYAFYLLSGIVDVLYNAGFPFPRHTDYVSLLLAVASEGLLFYFHVHGRPPLDVMVHTLLVYTIAAVVVCIIAEMCRPQSVLVSLGRAYFCLLQATWIWQIAFILYGHNPWDVDSHMAMMLAASAFAWHMMAVLVYVGVLGAVALVVNRTFGRFCHDVVSGDVDGADDLGELLIKRDIRSRPERGSGEDTW